MEKRMAIDPSGSLGSLYDAHRDIVRGKQFETSRMSKESDDETLQCMHCRIGEKETINILQWMGFGDQQRINLLLFPNSQQNMVAFLQQLPPSNKATHLLYIRHVLSKESCKIDQSIQGKLEELSHNLLATHLITEVSWGISALIFLRVSNDTVDNHIMKALEERIEREKFDTDESIFKNIQLVKVYSNIQDLTSITELSALCLRIDEIRRNPLEHQRIEYGITPLKNRDPVDYPLATDTANRLEKFLLDRWSFMDSLQQMLHRCTPFRKRRLIELSQEALQQHQEQLVQLQEAVTKLPCRDEDGASIDRLLTDESFARRMEKVKEECAAVEKKLNFIDELKQKGVEYVDVSMLGIKQEYPSSLVNDILLHQGQYKRIFCSDDQFQQKNETEWDEQYSEFISMTKKDDSKSKFLYADFTYSTYQLDRIFILPLKTNDDPKKNPVVQSKKRVEKKEDDNQPAINILLLGQSGVGKSTFINAFVNYLRFSSLDEAEKEEPTVVIPVSFVLSDGFDLKEKVINFGEPDPNENHNNNGQSVTEHCKSYHLRLPNGRKLCIIDTPGFGDTRGIEQDQINLTRIFNYIGHLSYLNGVCLLFKSNESELHQCFSSYFNQLIDYFGNDIKSSFLFCYTNCRSTFFLPGNSQKLLGDFFKKQSIDIKFQHRVNTFCFDSESFRFLVARRNLVEFSDDDRIEFGKSWLKSTGEATHLFTNLENRNAIRFQQDGLTHGRMRLKIELYKQPMLEALRIIIYNIALHQQGRSIVIHATHSENSKLSLSAKYRFFQQVNSILLPLAIPSVTFNKCLRDLREPFPYTIDYECVQCNENVKNLKWQCNMISESFAAFIQFLTEKSSESRVHPFLSDIDRMIKEQLNLNQQPSSTQLYQKVCESLVRFKTECQETHAQFRSDNGEHLLKRVSGYIELVHEIPLIRTQIEAISKHQKMIFENNQRIIWDS